MGGSRFGGGAKVLEMVKVRFLVRQKLGYSWAWGVISTIGGLILHLFGVGSNQPGSAYDLNKHWINCMILLYCSPQAAGRSTTYATIENPATTPFQSRDAVPTCCFPSKVYNRSQIQINSPCPNDAGITLTIQ